MSDFLAPVFQTGFFESSTVGRAVLVGGAVAVAAGALGTFTVMRRQSFAAEAFGDIGTSGGSAAFLAGVSPLSGFLVFGVLGAVAMELFGVERARSRDLATGIVLGAALGLAALFLYLDATLRATTGAAVTVLFGSIFTIPASTVPVALVLALAVGAAAVLLQRPLLLSTVSPEIAAARGIPVRLLGIAYLLTLAVAVALCALTIGAILSTALLVGPAASAMRLTKRPAAAALVSSALALVAMLGGIVLAYDSYYWPPHGTGWPVSFFVVSLVFIFYLLSGLAGRTARTRGTRTG